MKSLVRLLALGLLGLIALTWKLWTPQDVFPQVPLIRAACTCPARVDWVCLGMLAGSAICLAIFAREGYIRRIASAAVAVSLATLVVLDQHRLQPWAWQFFVLLVVMCFADDVWLKRLWMSLVISIYFWSAVSKLDYTFFNVHGPALMSGLRHAVGLDAIPNAWARDIDMFGAVAVVLAEFAVAFLLAWPGRRRIGLGAATIMHVLLLAALGPFGLNHSHGVLGWNLFFIAQNWLLFAPPEAGQFKCTAGNVSACVVTLFAIAWPVLEPFGWCDPWLAWAVYSGRPATVTVIVDDAVDAQGEHLALDSLPFPIDPASRTANTGQWSLQTLGVPTYPGERFQTGVVQAMRYEFGIRGLVGVRSPPDRTSGHRTVKWFKLDAEAGDLDREVDSFWWNARPRPITSLK